MTSTVEWESMFDPRTAPQEQYCMASNPTLIFKMASKPVRWCVNTHHYRMHVSLLYGNAGLIHCHMPSMYHKNGKSLESVFPSDLSDAGRNTSQHHAAENLRSCTCPRDISVAVIAFLLITDCVWCDFHNLEDVIIDPALSKECMKWEVGGISLKHPSSNL